jgi:hypothetical protein
MTIQEGGIRYGTIQEGGIRYDNTRGGYQV